MAGRRTAPAFLYIKLTFLFSVHTLFIFVYISCNSIPWSLLSLFYYSNYNFLFINEWRMILFYLFIVALTVWLIRTYKVVKLRTVAWLFLRITLKQCHRLETSRFTNTNLFIEWVRLYPITGVDVNKLSLSHLRVGSLISTSNLSVLREHFLLLTRLWLRHCEI